MVLIDYLGTGTAKPLYNAYLCVRCQLVSVGMA